MLQPKQPLRARVNTDEPLRTPLGRIRDQKYQQLAKPLAGRTCRIDL